MLNSERQRKREAQVEKKLKDEAERVKKEKMKTKNKESTQQVASKFLKQFDMVIQNMSVHEEDWDRDQPVSFQ